MGKFVAVDKFQGLTNPHEPIQRFVVEVQKGELFAEGQVLKVIYFAETTSIRGGAKFLGDETLEGVVLTIARVMSHAVGH